MEIIFGLLFFVICLSSLIISFLAIIKIASNDFKESKLKWILISMIAIVGPILWLTIGRKLIIDNEQYKIDGTKSKVSVSTHYTKLFKKIGIALKILFLLSLSLILYGYVARQFNIYFFWESKAIGFGLLLITIAKFIMDDISARRENKMHLISFYLILGILCLSIFIKVLFAFIIPNSEAYASATKLLKTDLNLINQIGEINSISYFAKGNLETRTDENGTTGSADLFLLIKGEKKYVEKNVLMSKKPEEKWEIIEMK
ncbi:hypothetical protein [Mesohalobacter halotolerans]|uniref:Uncharacterized protein n=1 Tax=Mesohalobacter halotolerans TaxID=1883405 RepID=A0A4U5TSC0_9FLAO|nr:hypothetical protein [Mesohalobacter halotolerans]TKS57200.1 hypothetical protein FCN74_01925 [Mesohalobacter halotolerans]